MTKSTARRRIGIYASENRKDVRFDTEVSTDELEANEFECVGAIIGRLEQQNRKRGLDRPARLRSIVLDEMEVEMGMDASTAMLLLESHPHVAGAMVENKTANTSPNPSEPGAAVPGNTSDEHIVGEKGIVDLKPAIDEFDQLDQALTTIERCGIRRIDALVGCLSAYDKTERAIDLDDDGADALRKLIQDFAGERLDTLTEYGQSRIRKSRATIAQRLETFRRQPELLLGESERKTES